MTDAEKQELVDRVMSFVQRRKSDHQASTNGRFIFWASENLHINWDYALKALRFSVRVASSQAGILFSDITVLRITMSGGQQWRREDLALKALHQLRQLMILDDLASIADAISPSPSGLASIAGAVPPKTDGLANV